MESNNKQLKNDNDENPVKFWWLLLFDVDNVELLDKPFDLFSLCFKNNDNIGSIDSGFPTKTNNINVIVLNQ